MSGFIYTFECFDKTGTVKWTETVHNILPTVALNYLLSSALNAGARYSAWFIGIYPNNYLPTANDTMLTLYSNAGEVTSYDEITREAFIPDGITSGLFSNYATPAEFTMNAAATIRGGFITSDSTKNSTSGILLSAALFSSPRTVASGEILKVRAGIQLASV